MRIPSMTISTSTYSAFFFLLIFIWDDDENTIEKMCIFGVCCKSLCRQSDRLKEREPKNKKIVCTNLNTLQMECVLYDTRICQYYHHNHHNDHLSQSEILPNKHHSIKYARNVLNIRSSTE